MKLRIFISFYIQIIEIQDRDDWNIELAKVLSFAMIGQKSLHSITIKYCHQSIIHYYIKHIINLLKGN